MAVITDGMDLAERLSQIRERIHSACQRAGRSTADVNLVAVSKTFPLSAIEAARDCGQIDFGENKMQDLVSKSATLPGQFQGGEISWHMIGHLQRNKARDIVRCADLFHALDSARLARELNRRCDQAERDLACFVQVNISGEETKAGISPVEVISFIDQLQSFPRLQVAGLMTLASPAQDPEEVRLEFRSMRRLLDEVRATLRMPGMNSLSMGMSGDFEVAIEEGATHVRIGSAIFGSRSSNHPV